MNPPVFILIVFSYTLYLIESKVINKTEIEANIFLLKLLAPEVANFAKPGQFINIKVSETNFPLLRRPFSICNIENDFIYIMFNTLGEGTNLLSKKNVGEKLNILGPLGNGFNLNGNYSIAVVVAGGLGVAPFPFLINEIDKEKDLFCFVGGKSAKDIIKYGLRNVFIATEDGSLNFEGNVIQLVESKIDLFANKKIKIFSCGPLQMLKALKTFAEKNNFDCEVSTECAMACGFGICQGCPVESANQSEKYLLVCKDGPVFNIKDIVL